DDVVVRAAVPVVRSGVRLLAATAAAPAQGEANAWRRRRGALGRRGHRRGDEEGAHDAKRAFVVFIPFGGKVCVTGAPARAQRDGGDAERDGNVCVGRGAGEVVLVTYRTCGGDGGLHQRMSPRRQTRRPVT